MTDSGSRFARLLAAEFQRRMLDEYMPRIEKCVRSLSQSQLWQRQHSNCNAVGNLLLHLEGNVRRWILCGLDGQPDRRQRDAEFAARPETEKRAAVTLLARLRATVEEACAVVERLPDAAWLASQTYQGRYRETGVAAVLHVMEHFSGHAGQIYAFTKRVQNRDLGHYDLQASRPPTHNS